MSDFAYSNEAMNVVAMFHEAENMFYVEGDDDVVFWESILNTFNISNLKVQSVNGVEEVKKLILKVKNLEINSIIARDLDFSILENSYEEIPNVLTTCNHSIENTLLCENVISKVIKSHGRFNSRNINIEQYKNWLNDFFDIFSKLVVYDALNEIQKTGVSILGSNCTKFMEDKRSPFPSTVKINRFIQDNKLETKFSDLDDILVEEIIDKNKKVYDFMRGHFLFSGVLKYVNYTIKELGSKKTASENSLFGSVILAFESVFKPAHPHYEHYKTQVQKILQ